MTDVEKLLRETLTDPRHRLEPVLACTTPCASGRADDGSERSGSPAPFTVVVVIAGVATAIGVNSGHRRGGQVVAPPSITAATPSITPSPHTRAGDAGRSGKGSTTSWRSTSSSVFVAATQPNQLLAGVDGRSLGHQASVATPDAVDGVAVDAAAGTRVDLVVNPNHRRRLGPVGRH